MTASEILLAISARKKGSWQQFKEIVDTLHSNRALSIDSADDEPNGFNIYREIRLNLQRLAHVEFFSAGCERGWRVAPPVMATAGGKEDCQAILTGARSMNLLYGLLGGN